MPDAPLLQDRYRVLHRLGSGTFSTVYLADDLKMGRQVAVKVVDKSRDVEGRALREAQAAAKLSHPHIVTVYEVTQEADRTLLFTEYVEGATLRELFREGRLSDGELLQVGIQACRALEHAHRRGVIHRDIKPENVMLLRAEGVDVRLMDFGIAHLEDLTSITVDGELLGTLAYMAPEQLDGLPVDEKTDVYALALTLYEGLTGVNPYRGKDAGELLRGTAVIALPRLTRVRPDLPVTLAEALELGLERDSALRPDAAGLRKRLERAARELPEPEEAPTLVERTVERIRPVLDAPRIGYVSRRVLAGSSALAVLAYALERIPFYPESWLFPLIVVGAFASLLLPAVGVGLTLVLLLPPIAAFAPGWGLLYGPLALVLYLLLSWRRLVWALLLPAAMPVLVAAQLGLALPVVAGALWRRWGPLAGFVGGLVLAVAAGMEGWERLPYTFTAGPGPVLLETRHTTLPADVLLAFARFLDSRPELLLQALLFALFSIPLTVAVRPDVLRRLWVAAVYLAALVVAFALLPPALAGASVDLSRLLLAAGPCAIIVVLVALLTPSERPRATPEG
jgi:hypothetical protein